MHGGFDARNALAVARHAASAAASLMRQCYAERAAASAALAAGHDDDTRAAAPTLEIQQKNGANDLVTRYDRACEEAIVAILRTGTPGFGVIAEEGSPAAALTDQPTWIVDPIDGTMSFVHGSFDCCVSIGLAVMGRPVLGVVNCPFVGTCGEEVYGGPAVGGVWCNERRLPLLAGARGEAIAPSRAAVCLNMPWRLSASAVDAASAMRDELAGRHQVQALKAFGASVFQMAQLVLGRIDAYSEPGGRMWDVCAGAALIEGVGGTVLSLEGGPFSLREHTMTAAATPALAAFMADLCKRHQFKARYWAPLPSSKL